MSDCSKHCILCQQNILKKYETFLVEGKGKTDVSLEIKTLPFEVEKKSVYICRVCRQHLCKRRSLLNQIKEIETLLESYQKKISKRVRNVEDECSTPRKLPCLHVETSSPARIAVTQIPRLPFSPINRPRAHKDSQDNKCHSKGTVAFQRRH